MIKLAWSAFSLGEATLKGEIAGYAAEYIIQEVIDDTRINWISDIFDIYGSFVNLVDAISSTPNFTVPVVNYCADNPLYKVFIKRSNGYLEPMYSITDDE